MTLINTLVLPVRTDYANAVMDKNEGRFSKYGVLDFYQQQTKMRGSIIDPQTANNAAGSFGKSIQIPVMDAKTVTIGNSRSCTVVADENTSRLVTLTWQTYQFGFQMTPSQHYNNNISYEQDFAKKLNDCLLTFAPLLDTACRNKLEADKNAYFPAELLSYYAQVGNALQVDAEEADDVFNQLEAIMMQMDFGKMTNVVGSTSLMPRVSRLKAQGSANAVNQSFQMNPYAWNFSNRVTNNEGKRSTFYAVEGGNVAILNRNDPDTIARRRIHESDYFDIIPNMPVVNMDMGYRYYASCADQSALAPGATDGLTATVKEGHSFYTDVCYVTSYNSDPATRYSPILKVEIANT